MNVILHEMAHSPFCIPVRRILESRNIPFETKAVPAWDRRALAKLTEGAYYQVPVLEYGENLVFETHEDPLAVAHFLDRQFTNGTLFPTYCAGTQEIVIDHIENTLEGIAFKIGDPDFIDTIPDIGERLMVIRHKERKFGADCVELWRSEIQTLLTEFEQALSSYEVRLQHSRFLFSNAPVYADFALFGVIGNFEYGGNRKLGASLPNLSRWYGELETYRAELTETTYGD